MPVLVADRLDSLITATEAANILGVAVCTITAWNRRGHLEVRGINHLGRKVYRLGDVAEVENPARR